MRGREAPDREVGESGTVERVHLPPWMVGAGTVLAAGAVLVATLTSAAGPGPAAEGLWTCFLCGDRGVADAIMNVVLFLPLGFLLSLLTRAPLRTLAALVFFSVAVEVAQLWIPGRYSSSGDVISNSVGAATGIVFAFRGMLLVRPSGRDRRVLRLLAFVVASAAVATTALLDEQRLPEGRYHVRWTPEIEHLEAYRGSVTHAALGGRLLKPGGLDGPGWVGEGLGRGETLELRIRVGPRSERLAPLLTVHDHREREILLLGLQGDDVIFRVRLLADALRLARPELRLPDAVRRGVGATTVVKATRRVDGSYCLSTEELARCGLGIGPADGWSFLLSPPDLSGTERGFLRGAWLLALFLPVGYLAGGWRGHLAAALLPVVLLYGFPLVTTLLPTPAWGWAGALTGLLAGLGLATATSAHPEPAPPAPR
ncbi:MAG: VanZ family protein [Longimicrobiales bacterium]|nr:VanZ family protein [Longimicrobiales bacterium]